MPRPAQAGGLLPTHFQRGVLAAEALGWTGRVRAHQSCQAATSPQPGSQEYFSKRCKQGKLLSWADAGSSPALTAGIADDPSTQSPE